MNNINQDNHTINHDNPLVKKTGNKLGQSWSGAEGSLGGDPYTVDVMLRVPTQRRVAVKFSNKQIKETAE